MTRSAVATFVLLGYGVVAPAAAAPREVEYTVHSGHFERNDSGLSGPASYLVVDDRAAFDRLFGVAFTMGPRPKVVPDDAFGSKRVVAVIRRGNQVWTYKVAGVTVADGVLTVRYTSSAEDHPGATFASPMIVSVPRGSYRQVVLVENGNVVGRVEVVGAR